MSRSDSPDPAEQGREEGIGPIRVGSGQCGERQDPRVVHNEVAPALDPVCEHGVAMDVHCCGCHSGFLFDIQACVCLGYGI
jgi:hypothetical protein